MTFDHAKRPLAKGFCRSVSAGVILCSLWLAGATGTSGCRSCEKSNPPAKKPLEDLKHRFDTLLQILRTHQTRPSRGARRVARWIEKNKAPLTALAHVIPAEERSTSTLIRLFQHTRTLVNKKWYQDNGAFQRQAFALLRLNRKIIDIYRKRLDRKRKELGKKRKALKEKARRYP